MVRVAAKAHLIFPSSVQQESAKAVSVTHQFVQVDPAMPLIPVHLVPSSPRTFPPPTPFHEGTGLPQDRGFLSAATRNRASVSRLQGHLPSCLSLLSPSTKQFFSGVEPFLSPPKPLPNIQYHDGL